MVMLNGISVRRALGVEDDCEPEYLDVGKQLR